MKSRPVLKPTVLLCPSDDSYLAYDLDAGRLHRLNPLAALIVELANGDLTKQELVDAVSPLLARTSSARCADWIWQATQQGLLVDAREGKSFQSLSAGELHQLAEELWCTDRVLAAFVCQYRATELDPDEPHFWYQLGELANRIGRRSEARHAYQRYLEFVPEDVRVEHQLLSLHDQALPSRVSDRCIEQLHGHFASSYEQSLCRNLDYRAPELLFAALTAAMGPRTNLVGLDVGCGTGLFGERLRPISRRLVGIDLSAAMLERATDRGIYDRLEITELTQWLRNTPTDAFDVIAFCDTLIYFGDLTQILSDASRHLAPGGFLGFTVERGTVNPFQLTDSGRFAHHQDHLLQAAADAGYRVVSQAKKILRYESGTPVSGWVTVLAEDDE
ncbi:MAG: methyltransferase domain-containing protein [Planctomycetes bacterium]|nr:methyltransferase domain-containing protein [Planctomycetota bacterium]